jgi:fibronectin type 3 domain-containing protein
VIAYIQQPVTESGSAEVAMRQLLTFLLIALMVPAIASCNGGDSSTTTPPGATYPANKPQNITATAGSGSATLTWDTVAGAVGYHVYISTDGFDFQLYQGELFTTNTVKLLNLVNGKTYYFAVSAVGSTGWETALAYPGGSPTARPIKPKPGDINDEPWAGVPPPAPQNLQGMAYDGAVDIYWEGDMPADWLYFVIYRKTTGEWEERVSQYTGFSYRDEDLINGITYSYQVAAVDDESLESDPSNRVDLKPIDSPPLPLEDLDILVKAGRLIIEWDTPVEPDIIGYIFSRVEPDISPFPGVDVTTRFQISKPVGTYVNPDIYADGLIYAYVDLDFGRTTVEDRSVVEGKFYKYYISAIDNALQEGPPVYIDHADKGPTY